jgi:hypothetical protein
MTSNKNNNNKNKKCDGNKMKVGCTTTLFFIQPFQETEN